MHFFFEREREQSSQLKEYFIILNPLKFQMKDAKNKGLPIKLLLLANWERETNKFEMTFVNCNLTSQKAPLEIP